MRRILIIQDSPSVNAMLKFRLERAGFSVDAVETGKGGVEKSRTLQYGIILLDYNLPDMNGDEVCRTLKGDRSTREIPVVLMSAKDEKKLSQITEEAGADGYIGLPFEGREFIQKIESFLKASAAKE